jgi:hypothetical protein
MLVTRVPELLRQHRVDVVFSGHDHIYERGDAGGLRYIVSGGGGAPLYKQNKGEKHTQKFEAAYHYLEAQVAKDALTITAVRLDGSLLEKCALVAGGASSWSCGEVEATPVAAPLAVGGSAPVAAPSASAPTPVRGKSCGCDLVGATRDWAGLLLVGTLSAGMLLRRTSNPSATRRRRGMIDEDER